MAWFTRLDIVNVQWPNWLLTRIKYTSDRNSGPEDNCWREIKLLMNPGVDQSDYGACKGHRE